MICRKKKRNIEILAYDTSIKQNLLKFIAAYIRVLKNMLKNYLTQQTQYATYT